MSETLQAVPIAPFGAEISRDMMIPLSKDEQESFRAFMQRHKLPVFRKQNLAESEQVRVMGYLGNALGAQASDQLLDEVFALLYAEHEIDEHRWNTGDLVVWDHFALQHARGDLRGISPRILQRVAVADKRFFELCPQFDLSDPRIAMWGRGEALRLGA